MPDANTMKRFFHRKKSNGSQESVNFLPSKDRRSISDSTHRSSNSSDYQETLECTEEVSAGGDSGVSDGIHCLPPDATPPGKDGAKLSSGSNNNMKRSSSDTSHVVVASTPNNKTTKGGSEKKKKGSSWYNVLSPTYKSRSEDFKRIFKEVSNDERLIVDYSSALQKEILVQGRLYIAQNHVCFYANIFRWETVLTIRYDDITAITKERTARVIPNAIQICTRDDKYFFTSFGARDKTYVMLFRVWQNALLDQPMTPQELWQWVHYNYGEELGLTSSDDDYLPPTQDDELSFNKRLQTEEVSTGGATSADQSSSPQSNKEPPEGPEGTEPDAAPTPFQTLHASLQNVSLPAVSINGANGTVVAPRVVRPATLQVPDVDAGGMGAEPNTDQGDTTSENDEEVFCEGHEHKNIQCLDEVFSIPIDRLFEVLFSDSPLFRAFMDSRKTSDLEMTSWTEPDSDGNRTRELKFTLALTYTLGPKCSYSHEKQTCYASSQPGLFYLVDAEFFNRGIPYGENFYVINRYCLTRVSSHKSRLRVTGEVNFRKKVWALVKNYIDKNAAEGIMQNFEMLAEHLHREPEYHTDVVPNNIAPPVTTTQLGRKKVRRKKRPTSTDRSTKRLADVNVTKHTQVAAPKGGASPDEWVVKFNMETLARIFCIILVCLVIFNAVLFVKLRSLESMTCMTPFSRDTVFPDSREYPKSQDGWLHLLERQQILHETEIKRWKDVLSVVIKLMDQMKLTLIELEHSITRASSVDGM